MAATELSTGYLSVAVAFDGQAAAKGMDKLLSGLLGKAKDSGKTMGESLGGGVEQGVTRAQADINRLQTSFDKAAQASKKASAAQESAADRVAVAQAKLNDLAKKGTASEEQRVRAQAQLRSALRQQEAAVDRVRMAEAKQEGALKELAAAQKDVADEGEKSSKRVEKGWRAAIARIGSKLPLSGMSRQAGDAGDKAGRSFSQNFTDEARKGVSKLDMKYLMAGAAGGLAAAAGTAMGGGAVDLVKNSIAEAQDSAKVGQLTESQLKATGAAAWATSDSIGHLAETISNKTGIDDEAIQSSANMLLSFKAVKNAAGEGANIFDRATSSAQDLAATGLTSAEGATKALGKALQDPITGLGGLSKAGVTFTKSEKDKVKALVESGKQLEAQQLIMGKVESVSGGAAAASATASEKLATMWGNTQEALGTALLPLVDKAAIGLGKILPIISEKLPVAIEWLGDKTKPLTDNLGHLVDLLFEGDFTGSIFGLEEDSPAVAGLLKVRDFVKDLPTSAKNLYSLLFKGDFTGGVFGFEEDSPVVAGLISARDTIKDMLGFVSRHQTTFGALATGILAMATAWSVYNAVTVAGGLVAWIGKITGLTRIWAGVQTALNVVMSANPIGIVVLALVGLAAGLVYAYKHSETFRQIVNNAWSSVKNGTSSAWNFMRDRVLAPMGRFFTQTIPNAARSMGRGISSVWDGIKAKTSGVWTSVRDRALVPMKNFFTQTIPNAAKAMGRGIAGMWDGIKSKANSIWTSIRDNVLNPMKTFFTKTIPGAATTASTEFGKKWDAIKKKASEPVKKIVDVVWNDGIVSLAGKAGLGDTFKRVEFAGLKTGGIVPGSWDPHRRDNVMGILPSGDIQPIEPGEMVVNREQTARHRGVLESINAGKWPVGSLGEVPGDSQQRPASLTDAMGPGVPSHLAEIIRRGPEGDGGIGGPVDWALGQLGRSGWYRRCLAFVNAAWGHSVGRLGMATARQSMNAGPLSQGVPPAGAAAYYNTSGRAGHVALSMGDGSVLSNDIMAAGRIDRVPYNIFASKWGAPYTGYFMPGGGGAQGKMSAMWSGFTDGLSSVWDSIKGKFSGLRGTKLPGGEPWAGSVGGFKDKLINAAEEKIKAAAGAVVDGVQSAGTKLAGGPATMLGKKMAESRGWTGNEWDSLHKLWDKESGWNPLADNPTSDAYGIPQALPGSKMRSAGWDWRTNAATQIKWGLGYIAERYGSPSAAWAHSQRHNWYDQGGFLPTGRTAVMNGTGDVEPVFTGDQWRSIDALAGVGAVSLSGAMSGRLSSSGERQLVLVSGELTLNEDSTVTIAGIAQEVVDANDEAESRRSVYS